MLATLHHIKLALLPAVTFMLTGCMGGSDAKRPWVGTLRQEMGTLGARNWVVIAEAAFPVSSRRGLRVMQIDAEVADVLDAVESVIEEKHHLKPRVYVTEESSKVPYDYAPGIKEYQKDLEQALNGRETVRLDNDTLMKLLNNTSKSYRVLVIKTRTAVPYSSVFVELGSGYWDADSEAALRDRMEEN